MRKTENEKITENKIQNPIVSTRREAKTELGKQERYETGKEDIMQIGKGYARIASRTQTLQNKPSKETVERGAEDDRKRTTT